MACISLVAGPQLIATLLTASGLGPRAHCESLVTARRITVNGRVLSALTAEADPACDNLAIDGALLSLCNTCRYLAFHKPYRVLSSFTDLEGRPALADYIPVPDVYAVGRLDYDSEGLLILTNDGWLNHHLAHPRYAHPKTYLAQVEGVPGDSALTALRRGVRIKGRLASAVQVELIPREAALAVPPRPVPIRYRANIPTAWLEIVLDEGRKRQIRHMTAAVGHPTLRLMRTAVGPVALGDLPAGGWRDLTNEELHRVSEMLHRGERRPSRGRGAERDSRRPPIPERPK